MSVRKRKRELHDFKTTHIIAHLFLDFNYSQKKICFLWTPRQKGGYGSRTVWVHFCYVGRRRELFHSLYSERKQSSMFLFFLPDGRNWIHMVNSEYNTAAKLSLNFVLLDRDFSGHVVKSQQQFFYLFLCARFNIGCSLDLGYTYSI